ncbi:MAG: amylo-alpha-1,6-glucosidase [Chloroflexota bacterium]|nr:amylo-alpha-1,6-glucosidase [Chloroflexota bacterium]
MSKLVAICDEIGESEEADIVSIGYHKAIEILKCNIAPPGFKASRDIYNSIRGRDASITCLGAYLTGDKELLEASRKSLISLRDMQTSLGQVPNCYNLDSGKVTYYATDATAWWIMAVREIWLATEALDLLKDLWPSVKNAITWLCYQCLDNSGLIDSPPAADWMDSSVQRSGKVLYNNILHYKALLCTYELRIALGEEVPNEAIEMKRMINLVFWPDGEVRNCWSSGWDAEFYHEIIDIDREHYLNYLSYETYDDSCDIGAHCIAILWDIADTEKRDKILNHMDSRHVDRPFPVRVLEPVVVQPGASWNSKIDIYRPRHWQNLPSAITMPVFGLGLEASMWQPWLRQGDTCLCSEGTGKAGAGQQGGSKRRVGV